MALIILLFTSVPASAQTFEALGTRAAGMGGAFVAVADDASAVYWNPAGLALGGSYFSMVLDYNVGEAEPDDIARLAAARRASSRSARCPSGVSYYRLTSSASTPRRSIPSACALDRLTTHHAGVTLVQSLTEHFAVGATLKWVRGYAASGIVPDGDRDDLLDGAGDFRTRRRASSTRTSASWRRSGPSAPA